MFVCNDYILNGQGHGEFGQALDQVRYDPGLLRPYVDEQGRSCVTMNVRGKPQQFTVNELISRGIQSPVFNATSLRKDEWIRMDQVVLRAVRERLRAWADLAAANSFGGFDGMSKMVLEHETMSDPGEALVDMDGITEGRTDSPLYQLQGLPLPITHSSFWFSARRLAVSRNTGTPLDTTMAEACGRRVAEMIERTTIGSVTGVTYGNASQYGRTPTVYGYTNFPARITKTDLTTPTGSNPDATVADVLDMRDSMYDQGFYGPFMLYTSRDWDKYLDNDYYVLTTSGATAPSKTLRTRLREIEGVQDIRRLDFFNSTFSMVMVQMTSDVARAVIGLNPTTVQWETKGGSQVHFRVMAIMVPQLRADYNDKCGVLHATTA